MSGDCGGLVRGAKSFADGERDLCFRVDSGDTARRRVVVVVVPYKVINCPRSPTRSVTSPGSIQIVNSPRPGKAWMTVRRCSSPPFIT